MGKKKYIKMKNKLVWLLLSSALLFSCKPNAPTQKLSVIVPSGSPLLALGGVINELDYEVTVGPDLLPVAFSKGEKDLVVAPITIGAKLYNLEKSKYQLGAVLGWSNLHILSRTPVNEISDLAGKSVLAFAEHSTPGIMLRLATKQLGVEITYLKAVSDVGGPFINKQYDYVLISEPILSKIMASMQEEVYTFPLQNVGGLPKIAQFGIFVNPDINLKSYTKFMDKLELNIKALNEDPKSYAEKILNLDPLFESLGISVIENAIPRLDLAFNKALDVKEEVNNYLEYLVSVDENIIGSTVVNDSFYGA